MKLTTIGGRQLELTGEEKLALEKVCILLDNMANSMNNNDYCTLVKDMESTDYFDILSLDEEENELINEFIGQEGDCQNILKILCQFLYLLHEAVH